MPVISFIKEPNNTVNYIKDGVEQSLLPQEVFVNFNPDDPNYVRLRSDKYHLNDRLLYSDVIAPATASGKLLYDALRTNFFF